VALDLDDSPVGLMLTDTMAVAGKTADSTVAVAAAGLDAAGGVGAMATKHHTAPESETFPGARVVAVRVRETKAQDYGGAQGGGRDLA
jgi:hypothetical protein